MWDARLTQMELGERIGMDQSSLARRIRGERGWTPDQLVAVADALGVTVAYLFGESDQAEPEEAVAETA
jgi:transcriptional regulator with XRE-family HTH domain